MSPYLFFNGTLAPVSWRDDETWSQAKTGPYMCCKDQTHTVMGVGGSRSQGWGGTLRVAEVVPGPSEYTLGPSSDCNADSSLQRGASCRRWTLTVLTPSLQSLLQCAHLLLSSCCSDPWVIHHWILPLWSEIRLGRAVDLELGLSQAGGAGGTGL